MRSSMAMTLAIVTPYHHDSLACANVMAAHSPGQALACCFCASVLQSHAFLNARSRRALTEAVSAPCASNKR
jgi:hypothetical protein